MIKKKQTYEWPAIEFVGIESMPIICISGDGSNGDYTEEIIKWDDDE